MTGGLGFLGTHLVLHLNDVGHDADAFDLETPETDAAGALGFLDPLVDGCVHRGDVADYASLYRAIGTRSYDAVVHLAAVSTVQVADEGPVRAVRTNVLGTNLVLELCRKKKIPVIVASTDKVYGSLSKTARGETFPAPPYTKGFWESSPLNPRHIYDGTKACADLLALSYARSYKMPVVVTRACNYYGPADLHWNRLVPGAFRAAAKDVPFVVHKGMGNVRREYMHVDDACTAYALLLKHLVEDPDRVAGQAFNIGSGDVFMRREMVVYLLDTTGKTYSQDVVEQDAGLPELGDEAVDSTKMRALGWAPETRLGEGLERTWAWYKAYFKRSEP